MITTYTKICLGLVVLLLWAIPPQVSAEVEWHIESTLKTEAVPADVVISPDGRRIFVLTDDGNVLIYDRNGQLKDAVIIGPHVDQIKIGPRGERLFAASRQNKSVEIIELSFIHKINTTGSPSKGPQDASIVIAVFSDFQ